MKSIVTKLRQTNENFLLEQSTLKNQFSLQSGHSFSKMKIPDFPDFPRPHFFTFPERKVTYFFLQLGKKPKKPWILNHKKWISFDFPEILLNSLTSLDFSRPVDHPALPLH